MGYNATYDNDDLQEIIVDGMGQAGTSFLVWIEIFVIAAVLLFLLYVIDRFRRPRMRERERF